MKNKGASYWSEIKTLDERLSREPDSFCFARLSEIYLKVGLVADALHTARHGVARHPGYLAGQRALAMACHASDLRDESRTILERFTAAMPEDIEAQKILATLYLDAGDASSAMRTYTTVLDFMPDDVQSRKQLETLQQGGTVEPAARRAVAAPEAVEEEDILELSEADIVYDEELEEEPVITTAAEITAPEHHDPLSTQTLAELYEQQGFNTKALAIYQTLLAENPGNTHLLEKIAQLERLEAPASELAAVNAAEAPMEEAYAAQPEEEPASFFEAVEQSAAVEVEAAEAPQEEAYAALPEEETVSFAETVEQFVPDEVEAAAPPLEPESVAPLAEETVIFADTAELSAPVVAFDDISTPPASQDLSPFAHKEADNVVGTLDGWLENIRRIKACR